LILAGVPARLALISAFFSFPAWAAERPDLEALRSRIEALRLEITGTEDARSEARGELRESERYISSANRELRELIQRREAARAVLRSLAARKAAIATEMASKERELGALLAAMYRQGEPGHLRLLLSGSDPNQTARDLHYVVHILRAQNALMEALRGDLAGIRAIESEQLEKSRQITEIEHSQKVRRAELVEQQAARRKVLERVSAQLRTQRREVKNLERDESRLSRLVQELAKVIAATPAARGRGNDKLPEPTQLVRSFADLRGSMRLPLRGVLTNRYGTSRADGGPSWKGLFIKALAGEEVKAVAAGRVVFAEWMRGFGNLLILDHGNDYLTIYGYNESLLRSVGDEVAPGDAVATVGASGGGQETGLYFEMRHEGKAFDPEKWLVAR
jgi:septal ring factor EnvC (AmiA/AmiB activator)